MAHQLPITEDIVLQLLRTRVESARINLDLHNVDVEIIRDRCFSSMDTMLKYVATLTMPGIQHEALTFRAPANSWNHFLRDLASVLPKKWKVWLLSKVKYKNLEVSCLDIWPKLEIPERHGSMVRTVHCPQWDAASPVVALPMVKPTPKPITL